MGSSTLELLAPDPFKIMLSKGGSLWKLAIRTDKNTFFNDLDYKADIGQHLRNSSETVTSETI